MTKKRLPVVGSKMEPELRDRVKAFAKRRGRTVSSQLERWARGILESPDILARLEAMESGEPPGVEATERVGPTPKRERRGAAR